MITRIRIYRAELSLHPMQYSKSKGDDIKEK